MKHRFISALASVLVAGSLFANTPKYIFYYIGDGMGMGQVMGAEAYNRTVLGNNDHLLMMQFPVSAVSTTFSASSPVTDSAAAGTALATGNKTNNGMLGMTPDSTSVTSIAKTLFDDGYGIGLVTSVYPDDATPGAFYTHVPSRSMYYEIGKDAASCGYDFIGGSNLRGIKNKKTGEKTDLIDIFAENNVRVIRGTEGFDTITSRRVLMLSPFEDRTSNIGYTIDSIPGALTLPAMTEACIKHLERNGRDRFFMMVEGGNIDHAGHANDGGTIIKEVLNFQEALKLAYDFYLAHPDETLIVVTADHETGSLCLGTGSYDLNLRALASQKVSEVQFSRMLNDAHRRGGGNFSWDDARRMLADNFGFWEEIELTPEQEESLRAAFTRSYGKERQSTQSEYQKDVPLASEAKRILDSIALVGWGSGGHSASFVPVFAIGSGAENFKALNDNAQIARRIARIGGYPVEN